MYHFITKRKNGAHSSTSFHLLINHQQKECHFSSKCSWKPLSPVDGYPMGNVTPSPAFLKKFCHYRTADRFDNPKHPSPSHPFYSTTHTLLWLEKAIIFTLTIHYVWMCYVVSVNCLCWLALRNEDISISWSRVGHLCALIDAIHIFVGHEIEMD